MKKIPRSDPFLPDELIIEILSWLLVKPLLQFRCVSKSYYSLIFHPTFVNFHLQRSPKYSNLLLSLEFDFTKRDNCVISYSKCSFLDNPSPTLVPTQRHIHFNNKYSVVGSCNGLVCLRGYLLKFKDYSASTEYWVRFCNPATRLRSQNSPSLCFDLHVSQCGFPNFGFGYDKSSDTYKVVAVLTNKDAMEDSKRTQVKVYTMGGDHCWRDIQPFPAYPITFKAGCFLSGGTLNWLALRNLIHTGYRWDTITIDQLVIVSLDLGKETYEQLLLPSGLDEVPSPLTIGVLMDCLCLSHDYKTTHFVVWQMKEFGVQKSWTRLVNFSYRHLQVKRSIALLPLCISENGDFLMLIDQQHDETILYNRRDNTVQYTDIPKIRYCIEARDYVQSLVRPC